MEGRRHVGRWQAWRGGSVDVRMIKRISVARLRRSSLCEIGLCSHLCRPRCHIHTYIDLLSLNVLPFISLYDCLGKKIYYNNTVFTSFSYFHSNTSHGESRIKEPKLNVPKCLGNKDFQHTNSWMNKLKGTRRCKRDSLRHHLSQLWL